MTEVLALLALAASIACALIRPWGLPESVVAAAGAALLLGVGAISPEDALTQAGDLLPTLGFLAAILVIGDLAGRDGLFRAGGDLVARRSEGRPPRLLLLVVGLASLVTAVLGLDATVVLLTPAIIVSAAALGVASRPHTYACVHLANSASLLLPVSNLTNLLALRATGLSFPRFAGIMLLPWIAAILVEWVALRRGFARELSVPPSPPHDSHAERPRFPRYALAVIALTLVAFLVGGLVGLDPALAAGVGAIALAIPALARRRAAPGDLVRSAAPSLLVFVLGLGIIVRAATEHGLDTAVDAMLPMGDSLPALLGIATVTALLANAVNNLPAILIVLPALATQGTGPVLAALIGVNIGPNLTYAGSLATLLWRRVVPDGPDGANARVFLRLGVLAVPPAIVLSTLALWVALKGLG